MQIRKQRAFVFLHPSRFKGEVEAKEDEDEDEQEDVKTGVQPIIIATVVLSSFQEWNNNSLASLST